MAGLPTKNTRRPRNWEALRALESVSPPSPSPSFGTDALSNLCSVGEIPILFDVGLLENDISDLSISSHTLPQPHIQPSSSSLTVQTVGTFGPRRPVSESSTLSTLSHSIRDSVSLTPATSGYAIPASQTDTGFLTPRQGAEGYYDRPTSDVSGFTLSAYFSPSAQQTLQTQVTFPVSAPSSPDRNYCNVALLPRDDSTLRVPLSTLDPSSLSNGSISTILFASGPNSTSPSFTNVLSSDPHEYRDARPYDTLNARYPNSPAQSPPTSPQARSRGLTIRPNNCTPSSPAPSLPVHDKPRARTKSTSSNGSGRSGKSVCSDYYCSSSQINLLPKSPFDIPFSNPHRVDLPGILSWLENLILQLWIDQEGFRLVRPAFRLSAYSDASSTSSATDGTNALTHGTVEFVPTDTKPFVFHHGALDPPPVLRKLTMADDDSRDYISRQASLAIKSNGVYFVSGTETFDPGPPNPHASSCGPLRLTWRFDYLVEDSASKGRTSEKRLTPLSFSCSPGLLHPSHGKKIKIMQVVKKGLTPKLTSAKVEEAKLDMVPAHGSPEKHKHLKLKPDAHAVKLLHGTHRRARSALTGAPDGEDGEDDEHSRTTSEGIGFGWKKGNGTSVVVVPVLPTSDDASSVEDYVALPVPNEAACQLSRHILPPSEINHMLDEYGGPEPGPTNVKSLPPPLRHVH